MATDVNRPLRYWDQAPANMINKEATTIMVWRPPLIALPAFRGIADTAALSPAMREASLSGNVGSSNRPVIAVLLTVVLAFAWMLVARLGWRDPEVTPARIHETATRAAGTAAALPEAAPRKPDEVTHVTARRTALRR